MKILLQDKNTLMFLEKVDAWTSDPSKGLTFDTAFGAVTFCSSNGLTNVQFVTRLQRDEMEVLASIPMPQHRHEDAAIACQGGESHR